MVSGEKLLKQSVQAIALCLIFYEYFGTMGQSMDSDIKDREGERSSRDVYQGKKSI